jgi:glycosyltransferase involved in cell wall biosynthesis
MLSIIICTYNRDKFLKICLQSIATLTADKALYEVVVVNNNCTDSTDELCQRFAQQHPDIPFRQVVEKNQGLGFARNKGIAEARGEIISFIDDDAEATPLFVQSILNAFAQHPQYNALGGKILPIYEDGKEPEWLNKYLFGPISKVDYGSKTRPFPKKYPAGCNMVFRRQLFEKYGGFVGQLSRSDDKDMFLRLKKHREKVLYAADVVVYHHIPADRVNYESIIKIGYSNGKFEALRLKEQRRGQKLSKLAELTLKFAAGIAIGCSYFVRLKPEKGRYLIVYMYKMWLGYVQNSCC